MLYCSIGQAMTTLSTGPTDQVHEQRMTAIMSVQVTLARARIDSIDDYVSADSRAQLPGPEHV